MGAGRVCRPISDKVMEVSASAPGKVILLGEHSVVYGQPAIAVPVNEVTATARVHPGRTPTGLRINSQVLRKQLTLGDASSEGLAAAAKHTLDYCRVTTEPDILITIESSIPQASGLGSGAAVSAALVRALSGYLGTPLTDSETSAIVYEAEKLYHGTPSGIDNTVVCYNKPVYFVRGSAPQIFHPKTSFTIVIGDTGFPALTRDTVKGVRARWENDPQRYNSLFSDIGSTVQAARSAIEDGRFQELGTLLDNNQQLLEEMGVSSTELQILIAVARAAGAYGAKLSGGGGGGNMIAIGPSEKIETIQNRLFQADAKNVIVSVVR